MARDRAPVFGRDAELAELDAALAGTTADRHTLVVVRGASGAGRTALLTAAAERWRQRGVTVLWLGFRAAETPTWDLFGTGAVLAALREHYERTGDGSLVEPINAAAALCAARTYDSARDRARLLSRLATAIGRLRTAAAPAVVVVADDLEAVASPEFALVPACLPGVLLVAACRQAKDVTPAVVDLVQAADRRMDLGPLRDAGAGAVVAAPDRHDRGRLPARRPPACARPAGRAARHPRVHSGGTAGQDRPGAWKGLPVRHGTDSAARAAPAGRPGPRPRCRRPRPGDRGGGRGPPHRRPAGARRRHRTGRGRVRAGGGRAGHRGRTGLRRYGPTLLCVPRAGRGGARRDVGRVTAPRTRRAPPHERWRPCLGRRAHRPRGRPAAEVPRRRARAGDRGRPDGRRRTPRPRRPLVPRRAAAPRRAGPTRPRRDGARDAPQWTVRGARCHP